MSDIKVGAGIYEFAVGPEHAAARLDRFLAGQSTLADQAISRTRLKALIEDGCVRVGGAPARDAGSKVAAGDIVLLDLPMPAPAEPEGESIPLTIVHEDAQIIVIDKPAGLVVHPASGNETGTLVNALIAHCGESLSGIGGVRRPGIVHRLDKDTSGLMVVAKTDAAHHALARLFADHGRTKPFLREYRAFVWGLPARTAGSVNAPIGRHTTHRERMTVVAAEKGREAVTHYEIADTFGGGVATEMTCRLETGRTHQIRVHMAHLGHPLLGDRTYGAGFATKAGLLGDTARSALAALDRQALHAATLGFPHPATGELLRFESPLPPDLARLRTALAAA